MDIKYIFSLVVIGILLLNSCYYDIEEELYPTESDTSLVNCNTTNLTYSVEIEPIISANCGACHYGSSPSGGTQFDSYNLFKAICSDANAELLCRINWDAGCNPMPQGGAKMNACSILQIETWINEGFAN